MTDTITLYYENLGGKTQIAEFQQNTVSLDNSSTNVLYSTNSVNLIEAELDSGSMTITISPQAGSSAFEIRALTPSFSHSPITTGGATWAPSGSGTAITFTTPGPTSGYELTWLLNPGVPPIPLKVKIKRK